VTAHPAKGKAQKEEKKLRRAEEEEEAMHVAESRKAQQGGWRRSPAHIL